MARKYSAILADLDGTVNRGADLIPGVAKTYDLLRLAGIQWLFLTNNATKSEEEVAGKLRQAGLTVTNEQVITSASALCADIVRFHVGVHFMVIGEPSLVNGVVKSGGKLTSNPEETEVVVTALDTQFTYEKLKKAHLALQKGAQFWATNRDPSVPVEEGFWPGAGSIAASLETASGRSPDKVFGKPNRYIADLALAKLGLSTRDCIVVGDRLDTDINFARNAGIDSALVLSGAARLEHVQQWPVKPEYIYESLPGIMELFKEIA
jgi:4-nitrophenyl phosphatase